MNVLTKIYWIRVALGAVAGLASTAIPILSQSMVGRTLFEQMTDTNTLLNGITTALLIYLISYYIMKSKFASKVEKPTKIMTMGIFIYFFTWLVVWVSITTILIGPPPTVV